MRALELKMNIESNGENSDNCASHYPADVNELAGMAARRIALIKNRKDGLSWTISRFNSLNAVASVALREYVQKLLDEGVSPKQVVHQAVIKELEGL